MRNDITSPSPLPSSPHHHSRTSRTIRPTPVRRPIVRALSMNPIKRQSRQIPTPRHSTTTSIKPSKLRQSHCPEQSKIPFTMPSTCRAQGPLSRGLKPLFTTLQQSAATQKIISSACSRSCIYCDIWRLSALIASHSPLAARYDLATGTPTNSPSSSPTSSPASPSSPSPYGSIIKGCKKIEAHFQTQRAQLNSILSICAIAGPEAEEGLRRAHDRCAKAVEDLLDQEEDLEEDLLKDQEEQLRALHYGYGSQCSYPTSKHSHDRRPSMVH